MSEIAIHYTLTFKEYIRGQRLHAKSSFWKRFAFLLDFWIFPMLGLYCLGVAFYVWFKYAFDNSVLMLLACGAFLVCTRFYSYMRLRRGYRQTPRDNGDTEILFTEDSFSAEVPGFGKFEYSWNAAKFWRENENILLVMVLPVMLVVIPKRSISEPQLEELRKLLRRKVVSVSRSN
jgi:hypothetical protein